MFAKCCICSKRSHLSSYSCSTSYSLLICFFGFFILLPIKFKGKKLFKCTICEVPFASSSFIKRHLKTVHVGKKLFKCTICEVAFTSSRCLKRHLKTVHEGICFFGFFILLPISSNFYQCCCCFLAITAINNSMATHRKDARFFCVMFVRDSLDTIQILICINLKLMEE